VQARSLVGSSVRSATSFAKPARRNNKTSKLCSSFAQCNDEGCIDAICVEEAINVEMKTIERILQKEAEDNQDDHGPPPLVHYPPGWKRGDDHPPHDDDELSPLMLNTSHNDGYDLHHDVPGTPKGHRERGVTTEHVSHDDDNNDDDDGKKDPRSRQAMALGMCRDLEERVKAMLNGDDPDLQAELTWRQPMPAGNNEDCEKFKGSICGLAREATRTSTAVHRMTSHSWKCWSTTREMTSCWPRQRDVSW